MRSANSSLTDYHRVYPLLAHTNNFIMVDVKLRPERMKELLLYV